MNSDFQAVKVEVISYSTVWARVEPGISAANVLGFYEVTIFCLPAATMYQYVYQYIVLCPYV